MTKPDPFNEYVCECGRNDLWKISKGHIECGACLRDYNIAGLPSPKEFNATRTQIQRFDNITEAFKK